jgi:hypothetical protein
MLNSYILNTQRLLQNPSAQTSLYSTADLTQYINTARLQLAGEAECIRSLVTLTLTISTQNYSFSSITGLPSGVAGVYNIRQINSVVGAGTANMHPRPWAYFQYFFLGQPVPATGRPTVWAQIGQGVAGTVYLYPIPDAPYVLNLDCTLEPIALVLDTDPEAIPYPWTDAVPYMAAYYALLSSQRGQDAMAMLQLYEQFIQRARKTSTPSTLSSLYSQQPDVTMANKLGSTGGGGAG